MSRGILRLPAPGACLRGWGGLAPLVLILAATAVADEVRYYEQNGVTYRETRTVRQRPVVETEYRETTQTVYREQRSTEIRETQRVAWCPVTEYRWESYWVGRWNPLVEPYLAWRLVPHTRWEPRNEVVQTPVTVARVVPETQTVRLPVTVSRTVPEEVVTRVAVGASPPATSVLGGPVPRPVLGEPIGGVARLDKDPPRSGVSSAWRAATTR
jgi:hypothetical protein